MDTSGNAYVTGYTYSTDFPNDGVIQENLKGSIDVFVTKINAAGNAITNSTFLGGNDRDYGYGIAVDTSGNAYVTGCTWSTDFPSDGGTQADGGSTDAFVTKINAVGDALTYSTYLGGNSSDQGNSIAVDNSGNAYVTGDTGSYSFPNDGLIQAGYGS